MSYHLRTVYTETSHIHELTFFIFLPNPNPRLKSNIPTASQYSNIPFHLVPLQRHSARVAYTLVSSLSGVAVGRSHARDHPDAGPRFSGGWHDLRGGQQEAVGAPVAKLHREGVLHAGDRLRPVVRWTWWSENCTF